MKQHSSDAPQGKSTHLRIVCPLWKSSTEKEYHFHVPSIQFTRSLFYCSMRSPSLQNFRLLRIIKRFGVQLNFNFSNALENIFHLVNLRYLAVTAKDTSSLFPSICRLWNLHTIIVDHFGIMMAPSEIWKMPQLRCIKFNMVNLPDPEYVDGNDNVLRNLHTLSIVRNLKLSEEIIRRIPNIKKLRTNYYIQEEPSLYVFSNLDRLHKLESFSGTFLHTFPGLYRDITFPSSLKKLSIKGFASKDVLEKIGSLPFLEKLKLSTVLFEEHVWETVEGQFCNLKFLLLEDCRSLEVWTTDSAHFPQLEHLVLYNVLELKEIPSEIGEIPTLQSIRLSFCSESVVESAKRILDEQEELGNVGLQVHAEHPVKKMASRNFCRML